MLAGKAGAAKPGSSGAGQKKKHVERTMYKDCLTYSVELVDEHHTGRLLARLGKQLAARSIQKAAWPVRLAKGGQHGKQLRRSRQNEAKKHVWWQP